MKFTCNAKESNCNGFITKTRPTPSVPPSSSFADVDDDEAIMATESKATLQLSLVKIWRPSLPFRICTVHRRLVRCKHYIVKLRNDVNTLSNVICK